MDGGFQGCKEERGGGGGGFDTTLVEISPSYSRPFSTIEIVVALFVTELLCAKSLSLSLSSGRFSRSMLPFERERRKTESVYRESSDCFRFTWRENTVSVVNWGE